MRIPSLLLILLVLTGGCLPALRAELAPSAYEAMQHDAPEYVDLEILRVTTQPSLGLENETFVKVVAQVLHVRRSATALKAGDVITISYSIFTHPEGWVGPAPIPLLKEGARTAAYLAKKNIQTYQPAAGVMSFSQF